MKLATVLLAITLATIASADSSYVVVLRSGAEGALRPDDEQIDPAIAPALFPRLFQRYLKSSRDCPATWDARGPSQLDAGAFSPEIVSQLHGSFTIPKIKETLYVVRMGECAVATSMTTHRVIIVRNGEIVLNQAYAGTMAASVVNLDADGLDEWVAVSASCMNQVCVESARIVRAAGAKVVDVKDLGNTYFNDCCVHSVSSQPNHAVWSSVLFRDGKLLKIMDTRMCACL